MTWRGIIQDPSLLQLLFRLLQADIRSSASTNIKIKCALSLQHLAYVRHALFSDSEARYAFVSNFMTQMINLMDNFDVVKDRQVFKEIIPIILKIQINYQVRDLVRGGKPLFESYLSKLFKFTTAAFAVPSVSILFHASRLTHLWQRIFLEAMGLGLPVKDQLNDLLRKIGEAYLDGNLAMKANLLV